MQIFLIFFMRPKEFKFWKYTIRNYLGGHHRVTRKSFEFHIFAIGIMALVISVATILFALGFLVVIVQLGARLVCKNVLSISLFGQSIQNVCVG